MKSAWVSSLLAVGMLAFLAGCASGDSVPEASADRDPVSGRLAEPLRSSPDLGTPDPSPPACGGFAGIACPGSGSCVDNPKDNCDPTEGGRDCGGLCECTIRALCVRGRVFDPSPSVCACVPAPPPEPSGPFCGGIAGIACPGAGSCVDNPSDGCDPAQGGADCGGVCTCEVRELCVQGSVFDTAPDVCACVASEEPDACSTLHCAAGTHCESHGKRAHCIRERRPRPRECVNLD